MIIFNAHSPDRIQHFWYWWFLWLLATWLLSSPTSLPQSPFPLVSVLFLLPIYTVSSACSLSLSIPPCCYFHSASVANSNGVLESGVQLVPRIRIKLQENVEITAQAICNVQCTLFSLATVLFNCHENPL